MCEQKLYERIETALADSGTAVSTILNLYRSFLESLGKTGRPEELEWVSNETKQQVTAQGITPAYRIISAYTRADVLLWGSNQTQRQKIDYGLLSCKPDLCVNGQYLVGESVSVLEDKLRSPNSELILHQYDDFTVPSWSRVGAGRYQNVCVVCNRSEIINLINAIRERVRVSFTQFEKPNQNTTKKAAWRIVLSKVYSVIVWMLNHWLVCLFVLLLLLRVFGVSIRKEWLSEELRSKIPEWVQTILFVTMDDSGGKACTGIDAERDRSKDLMIPNVHFYSGRDLETSTNSANVVNDIMNLKP